MENSKEDNKMNNETSKSHCQCFLSTEESIHSRRCFMTGEYCSKQTNVQQERRKLYDANQISAFVIMNFSDMSDVVYKWRLHDFIESLNKYLYLDKKEKRLYCHSSEKEKVALKEILRDKGIPFKENEKGEIENIKELKKEFRIENVEKINVIRSDSDPASNYVICSRICQQMQIADLVIVDVSSQNPNVFYELGMAVALGKLILPLCYSESYYKLVVPDEIKQRRVFYSKIEHHIGCFPWRKNLFEYYGIRYRHWTKDELAVQQKEEENIKTRYLPFDVATNVLYGFSDIKYNRFPYHKEINDKKIGQTIYEKLSKEYNNASKDSNEKYIKI